MTTLYVPKMTVKDINGSVVHYLQTSSTPKLPKKTQNKLFRIDFPISQFIAWHCFHPFGIFVNGVWRKIL